MTAMRQIPSASRKDDGSLQYELCTGLALRVHWQDNPAIMTTCFVTQVTWPTAVSNSTAEDRD